jgi:transcriptional regulator with XRE-family HTH domain
MMGHNRETIAYNTYSTYEKGQREPRYLVLTYMAKLLDVSTDTLLGVQVEPEQADVWKLLLDHLQPGEAPRYKTPEQDLIVASTGGKLYRVTGKDWQALVQQADEDWQQELDQINQRRQQKLDRSIDRLLQQQRDKLKFEPDSDLGTDPAMEHQPEPQRLQPQTI